MNHGEYRAGWWILNIPSKWRVNVENSAHSAWCIVPLYLPNVPVVVYDFWWYPLSLWNMRMRVRTNNITNTRSTSRTELSLKRLRLINEIILTERFLHIHHTTVYMDKVYQAWNMEASLWEDKYPTASPNNPLFLWQHVPNPFAIKIAATVWKQPMTCSSWGPSWNVDYVILCWYFTWPCSL